MEQNRKGWRNLLSRDRKINIALRSWTNDATHRSQHEAAARDPRHAHLRVFRLHSRRDVARFATSVDPDRLTR